MINNSRTDPASSEALATLVEIVPMPLAFFDLDCRFVYANVAAGEQVGHDPNALRGELLSDVIPESWPMLEPIFERVMAGETIQNLEVDLSALSDEPRDWIGSFYPVHEDGKVVAVACTSLDITELRLVEHELQVRHDLFAVLARVNGAATRSSRTDELFKEICEIAFRTGNFRYAWVGIPRDGKIIGVASAGDDGGYMRQLQESGNLPSTDPDNPRSRGLAGQVYRTGEVAVDNRFLESQATEFWHEAAERVGFRSGAAIPMRERGEVAAILSLYAERADFFTEEFVETLNEIAQSLSLAMDRISLEQQRQKNEADLMLRDRALTAATQGVVITDAGAGDDPIIYVTPAMEELTGYTKEELLRHNCRMLQGADTDPTEVEKIRKSLVDGKACVAELINYRKSGESFWNRLAISPIFDDNGVLTHHVGVLTDVTEQRMLEHQMRQAQKMEAVGQLAGGVAHDFNNALTAIRGSVDLALSELDPGDARDDLKLIDEAAEHATQLTRQLLAFSRQQVLQPQSTDINRVIADTSDLVARVIGDNIELIEDLDPSIDAVLVDPAQMQQVIINLCINARDAMPDGGQITIRTSFCDLDDEYVESHFLPMAGRYDVLEIQDNGSGMDPQTQSRVFEPFFTTKSDGTGLGLATVYGIVNQTGGYIELKSEPMIGTTFRIYLPTTTKKIARARRGSPTTSTSLDGTETILHVEDSAMLRPLVARVLKSRGYKVLSAASAEEALKIAKAEEGHIALMITDIVMPGMNGRELADTLLAEYPDLRVLFTSGYSADILVQDEMEEVDPGFNFIEKPFVAKDLLPLVRSILDETREGVRTT